MHFQKLINPVDIDEDDYPNIKILPAMKKVNRLNTFMKNSEGTGLTFNLSLAPSWYQIKKFKQSETLYRGTTSEPLAEKHITTTINLFKVDILMQNSTDKTTNKSKNNIIPRIKIAQFDPQYTIYANGNHKDINIGLLYLMNNYVILNLATKFNFSPNLDLTAKLLFRRSRWLAETAVHLREDGPQYTGFAAVVLNR